MLEVRELSKWYAEVVALDRASFSVGPGRITGFLGPNGAGKTTTMRAIFGLLTPDNGTICWRGEPVGHGHRLRFGYMPEERGLYPRMEVRRHLTYFARLHGLGRAESQVAVDKWLRRLELTGREDSKVETLSHGNQQRVQLAAALTHDPELLVLDEPFSGLDPIAVKTMSSVLRGLAEAGATVLLSSHQLDLVEDVCEDVVIVNRGQVVMSGTIEDLRRAHPYRVLEVGFTGPEDGWIAGLPTVKVIEQRDGWGRYLVPKQVDPRKLLAGSGLEGEITHFFFGAPPLSEIFVEAVGSRAAPTAEGTMD